MFDLYDLMSCNSEGSPKMRGMGRGRMGPGRGRGIANGARDDSFIVVTLHVAYGLKL